LAADIALPLHERGQQLVAPYRNEDETYREVLVLELFLPLQLRVQVLLHQTERVVGHAALPAAILEVGILARHRQHANHAPRDHALEVPLPGLHHRRGIDGQILAIGLLGRFLLGEDRRDGR
jgi:hypothetical protein